eukprot:PhM_4_TR611/c0_g1_i1/m.82820
MFRLSRRTLIKGQARGSYLDYRPYDLHQIHREGMQTAKRYSNNRLNDHLLDHNDYANRYAYGHHHSRYRVWRCLDTRGGVVTQSKNSWSRLVSLLRTAKESQNPLLIKPERDRAMLLWELRKNAGLLAQSVSTATPLEVASLMEVLREGNVRVSSDCRVLHRALLEKLHDTTGTCFRAVDRDDVLLDPSLLDRLTMEAEFQGIGAPKALENVQKELSTNQKRHSCDGGMIAHHDRDFVHIRRSLDDVQQRLQRRMMLVSKARSISSSNTRHNEINTMIGH